MPLLREKNIFMLGIKVLNRCAYGLLKVHRLKAAESLALLAGTEDFLTYRSQYINNVQDVQALIHFKETCLIDFLNDFETKKILRPLLDCIDRSKRLFKLK
jgi:hypothetical protein